MYSVGSNIGPGELHKSSTSIRVVAQLALGVVVGDLWSEIRGCPAT